MFQPIFYPFSLLYKAGLSVDRAWRMRAQKKLPKPVISVGNITLGGTGKTPLLIRLVNDLKSQGVKPAILTRGYRGIGKGSGGAVDSDETALMKEKCPGVPVGVGADRYLAAQKILDAHAVDVFVLDDGFQHWPLARNLDVVCVDATDPWGGGFMVPAGRLREPASALARAQLIVITRAELVTDVSRIKDEIRMKAPQSIIIEGPFHFVSSQPVNGQKVIAVSALGNPAAFETHLGKLGAHVIAKRFPDHYGYREEDLKGIQSLAEENSALVAVTAKDWMKIKHLSWGAQPPSNLAVCTIEPHFSDADEKVWNEQLRKALA